MKLPSALRRARRALGGFLRGFLGLAGPPRGDSEQRCC